MDQKIFVDLTATGANDGTSWTDAFTDLQSALAVAYPCAEIWVAVGEYYPITCQGGCTEDDRNTAFNLINRVAIYGGFKGEETTLEERDYLTNITILSGDIGLEDDQIDNSFHVVYAAGVDTSAILDGFTIQDGFANESGSASTQIGGGMLIQAIDGEISSPWIRNCTFTANTAKGGGGAAFLDVSGTGEVRPFITNCTFIENTTTGLTSGAAVGHGAALGGTLEPRYENCVFETNVSESNGGAVSFVISDATTSSRPHFQSCQFINNQATDRGGALYSQSRDNAYHQAVVQSCNFTNNRAFRLGGAIFDQATANGQSESRIVNGTFLFNAAQENGGALFIEGSENGNNNTVLANSLLQNNTASLNGGAIYNSALSEGGLEGNCNPIIVNCTFYQNLATGGGGIIFNEGSQPEINNSILWDGGNEIEDNQGVPIISNTIIEGGYSGAGITSNVSSEDPLFLDPEQGDFRLSPCSPAVDAGINGLVPQDLFDVDQDTNTGEQVDIDLMDGDRFFNGTVDLGSTEWNGFPALPEGPDR